MFSGTQHYFDISFLYLFTSLSVSGLYGSKKNANLSDVTISKKLISEENDHAVKTRVPGTWGEEAKYVWLRKENIMEIHGGKTLLATFSIFIMHH